MKKNQRNIGSRAAPPRDKRLGRMVMLSGLLHIGLLLALVSAANYPQSKTRTPQTYTVALVSPASVGLTSKPPPDPSPKKTESAVVSPSPKPEPEQRKPKREKAEKKKKRTVAKPKKKKPVTIAAKKTPPPKKREPAKTEVKKPQAKKTEKEETPRKSSSPKEPEDQPISAEDRDQQIGAALEKVRRRVRVDAGHTAQTRHAASVQGGGGEGGDTVRGLPFILYMEQVKRRVKQSWIVAEQKSGLTAVVQFGILASGEVVEVELAERSGDILFDESTLRAVRKASPLPPPPAAYRNEFARQKVEVAFGETRRVHLHETRSD